MADTQKTYDGSFNALTAKVRAAHPGAYDDLDDAQLTTAILSKYPQYQDLALPKTSNQIPTDMEQSGIGGLMSGPDQNLASPKGQMAKDTTPSPAVGAVTVGAGLATGGGLAAEAVGPAVFRTLANAAESHPVVAKLLLHGLEAAGLGAIIKHSK